MVNYADYKGLGIVSFSSRKNYTREDVSNIIGPMLKILQKNDLAKVNSFIWDIDGNPVRGLDLVGLYKSIGWEEVTPRERLKFDSIGSVLKKHPEYGVGVSLPSSYHILFDPLILDKFNQPSGKVPSLKQISGLTKSLEDICVDTFIPVEELKQKRIYWDVVAAGAYKGKFEGDFLPSSTVILKFDHSEVTFFNKEFWAVLFTRRGNKKLKEIPKPLKEFSIPELLEEIGYYKPKEKPGLTVEEMAYVSSKFLTAYRKFKAMEINLGLSVSSIKKLALLMDKGGFASFSAGGNTFTRKDLSEKLGEVSDLEKLMSHYTDVVVHNNEGFINQLVNHYAPYAKSMSTNDLHNEVVLGIITALKKFDPNRGYKFLTYATWWAKHGILKALSDRGDIIRLPLYVTGKLIMLNKARKIFFKENQRYPSDEELAKSVSMSVSYVRKYLGYKRLTKPISLDTPIYGEESDSPDLISRVTYADLGNEDDPKDPISPGMIMQPDFVSSFDEAEKNEKVHSWLSTLTPREQKVLRLRFCIGDDSYGNTRTLQEVGDKFGLTRERIRQIESRALKKLRDPNRIKGMEYHKYFSEDRF